MTKRRAPTMPIVFWEDEREALRARIAELEAAQPVAVATGVDPLEVMALLDDLAQRMSDHTGGWKNGQPATVGGIVNAAIAAIPDHQCECEGECESDPDDRPGWDEWREGVGLVLRAMQGDETFPLDARQFLRKHASDEVFA